MLSLHAQTKLHDKVAAMSNDLSAVLRGYGREDGMFIQFKQQEIPVAVPNSLAHSLGRMCPPHCCVVYSESSAAQQEHRTHRTIEEDEGYDAVHDRGHVRA